MKRLCVIVFSILLPAVCFARRAMDFGELRSLMDAGLTTVEEDLFIEGLVLTDTDDKNIEQGLQFSYNQMRSTPNLRTVYLESFDGRFGFKLGFEGDRDGRFPRFTRLRLNLKGARLSVVSGAYCIDALTAESAVAKEQGTAADRPLKLRTPASLSDEDLYTYVSLTDMEFVFKDGSFSNIAEVYGKSNPTNSGKLQVNGSMDGWATLLCDSSGEQLYMLVNSRTPWRRLGGGVPSGSGIVSGVLVRTALPRYGDCLGRWQLRPLESSDFDFTQGSPAAFGTIAEWNWNDNRGKVKTEAGAMPADIGTGLLLPELECTLQRGPEPNARKVDGSTKGYVENGALAIKAPSCNWWDWDSGQSRGLLLQFSTEGVADSSVFLAFSFAGGNRNAATSMGFPVFWRVDYSTDGVHYTMADEEFELHSLPWYWENDIAGVKYPTSKRAGMGYTEHMLRLKGVCGQRNVYVRICPSRKNIATLALDEYWRMAARPGNATECYVNFGTITVRYTEK